VQSTTIAGGPFHIPGTPPECVKGTAPFYADWVAFGKPSCWCYTRNCHGDADGLRSGSSILGYIYVNANDLNILISGWNVKEPPKGSGHQSCGSNYNFFY
jgi:hypothetical protein